MPHEEGFKSCHPLFWDFFFLTWINTRNILLETCYMVIHFHNSFWSLSGLYNQTFLFITNKYLLDKESHCNQLELHDSFCQGWQNSLTYPTAQLLWATCFFLLHKYGGGVKGLGKSTNFSLPNEKEGWIFQKTLVPDTEIPIMQTWSQKTLILRTHKGNGW